ncbi:MAG: TetR/AcrR family transcriptional regulator [Ruminococcus sp.]|nr:TetR/AcrR family transcriptional regulator [Ruminococcus sp.]
MTEQTNNKERILQCALKLFSKKGYDGTSTMDIVNTAQVTKPTMYHYFGSKEGLLSEILEQNYTALSAKLKEAANLPQDISLTFYRIARVYFDGARENLDFFRFRMGLMLRTGEDAAYLCARKYIEEEYAIIKDFFDNATKQAGNLAGKESLCTITLIGVLNAAVSAYLYLEDEAMLSDETIYKLRQQFLHGIYS